MALLGVWWTLYFTGTPVDVEFADCYEFKDGLLWRRKSHFFVPVA